jgi:hypothetical protein
MPSTKPNIMITARLLLMPVFNSVESKAWANSRPVLANTTRATNAVLRSRAVVVGRS